MFEYDYKCAIKSDNIHINNGPYQHIKKKPFILVKLLQYSFVSRYL